MAAPPFRTDRSVLMVAFYASAEVGCFLALDWPLPECLVDLYVEFRNASNGHALPHGASLLGALASYGLDFMDGLEKTEMRELALRGGPWTAQERDALLRYCTTDVAAAERLFERMLPDLDIPRALSRGRYMRAVAHMEAIGVPIDVDSLAQLRTQWHGIQAELIARIDANYGVFEASNFKADRFAEFIAARGIAWPRLLSFAKSSSESVDGSRGSRQAKECQKSFGRGSEAGHPAVESDGPSRNMRSLGRGRRAARRKDGPGAGELVAAGSGRSPDVAVM